MKLESKSDWYFNITQSKKTERAVGAKLKISKACVHRAIKRYRQSESHQDLPRL